MSSTKSPLEIADIEDVCSNFPMDTPVRIEVVNQDSLNDQEVVTGVELCSHENQDGVAVLRFYGSSNMGQYRVTRTRRFDIFAHEIFRDPAVGHSRTVYQAWFHSEDVPRPVCILTVNHGCMDYVEWIYVAEDYRREGIATEVLRACELYRKAEFTMDGTTEAGEAFVSHYGQLYPGETVEEAVDD